MISKEEPLLVNPTTEEPSEHITFDPLGKPIPRTDKGEASIEICNLDTKCLNDQRRKIIKETAGLFRLSKMARAKSQNPEAKQYLSKIEAMIRKKLLTRRTLRQQHEQSSRIQIFSNSRESVKTPPDTTPNPRNKSPQSQNVIH